MKQLLIAVFILLPFIIIGQETIDEKEFRNEANYKKAFNYYKEKIELDSLNHEFYYQAACYLSLDKNHELSFEYLKKAIELGAKDENVLTDTDFNYLKSNTLEWAGIETLIKRKYIERNPKITNPELSYEFWLMWIEDQRFRTLGKNYKLKEKPQLTMREQNERVQRLYEIINETGWPKYSEVGIEAGNAVFYVFQHHQIKDMKKVLPLLISTAKNGEADLGKAAMMIDRYLSTTENIQIYGTQAHKEYKKGQETKDIKSELYPIADEENMIRRRVALGMVDFYENCKRLQVEYVPIEQRTNYKPIKIKKSWVKKGYLLVE